MLTKRCWLWGLLCLALAATPLAGQNPAADEQQKTPAVPDLTELIAKPQSELAIVLQRFEADRGSLFRFYTIPSSPTRTARLKKFYTDWSAAVDKLDFNKFSKEGLADYKTLRGKIDSALQQLDGDAKAQTEIDPLVPFAPVIIALEESRQQIDQLDVAKAAAAMHAVKKQVQRLNKAVSAPAPEKEGPAAGFMVTQTLANRASDTTRSLRTALKHWYGFYNEYDPVFTWWMADLYKEVDNALDQYATTLKNNGTGKTLMPEPALAFKAGDATNGRYAFVPGKASDAPDLKILMAVQRSELREVIQRYQSDRSNFGKLPGSKGPKTAEGQERLKKFCTDWLAAMEKVDFDKLSREGQVDYILLRNRIEQSLSTLALAAKNKGEEVADQGGKKDPSGITGRPIGRDALLVELAGDMIAYSPEELLAIADKEFEWCDAEMKKAARDLGFAEKDWLKAVEKVKTLHVEPGKQPAMIRDLAWEAIAYLDKHDLVTVPALAKETWRMEMMSPQRQLVNPFFTGGEVISVSFPTNTMSFEDKLQSMRGNNVHFSRATVHHELIPGHHLQGFTKARFNSHRQAFGTPFWTEGWALYWEMVLYDRGFPKTAEDRVGFLFWRMHRCARIHFSLNFQVGKWTPTECIDYLVKRVGHEPANATAEVRRSFQGNYGPLYQAAYLLGGLQIRGLRKELVDSGKMSEKAFHDAVIGGGSIPIEMTRALITDVRLTRDYKVGWKFYGDIAAH